MGTFWTDASLEPKRKYRFKIEFGNLGAPPMESFFCRSVTKPGFSVGVTEHALLDYNFRFPGRVTWDPISAVFVDTVQHNTANRAYNLLKGFGYVDPTAGSPKIESTISKAKQAAELGNLITIVELSAEGAELGNWQLHSPMVTRASFGDLSYADETLVEVSIDITYDWATYQSTIKGDV